MEWKKRSAYVFIRTEPGKTEDIWHKVQKWEKTIGAWVVTGEWDIITWIDAQNWDEVYAATWELREWDGVNLTSSHFVYNGSKNWEWWWDKPAGTWVLLRDLTHNRNLTQLQGYQWITSIASVPGPWDYMVWISGDNWSDVWDRVWKLNKEGWQTLTKVPIRSWWNHAWEQKWWDEAV